MLGMLGLLGAVFAGALIEGAASRNGTDEEEEEGGETSGGGDDDADGHGNLLDTEGDSPPDDPFHGMNPFRSGGVWRGGWTTGAGAGGGSVESGDVAPEAEDTAGDKVEIFDGRPISDATPGIGDGEGGSDPVIGSDSDDLLDGSDTADLIEGGAGGDQINARDGDDTIYGGADDDIVTAGAGDDLAYGGAGNDELHGDAGDDSLYGGAGDDQLMGHEGNDLLHGGEGGDTLIGGEGDDSLYGEAGDDWLPGGEGDDEMTGGAGSDTLDGGAGDDRLWGAFPEGDDGEVDFLNGGAGDDILHLGIGDYGNGGEGADTFTLTQWLGEGGFATITDYDPQDDEIVLVYDPLAHASPEVTVTQSESGENSLISIDGFVVAEVNGHVDLSEIRLLAA